MSTSPILDLLHAGLRIHGKGSSTTRSLSCGKCSVSQPSSIQDADEAIRRASVAIILRQGNEGATEVLLIKRAVNRRDPWSGDLAFPGGRQNAGETDLETCIRETKEETGLDLCAGGICPCGRLDDITIGTRKKRNGTKSTAMVISTFVFCDASQVKVNREHSLDSTALRAPLKIQESEVAAAWWANLNEIWRNDSLAECSFPIRRFFPFIRDNSFVAHIAELLRCNTVAVPGVFVAPAPTYIDRSCASDFFLWGITWDLLTGLQNAVAAGGHAPVPRNRFSFRFSRAPWIVNLSLKGGFFAFRMLSKWSWLNWASVFAFFGIVGTWIIF